MSAKSNRNPKSPRNRRGPRKKGKNRSEAQGKKSSSSPRGERLQKILSHAGVASRRKAEDIIAQGRVQVNGHTVTRPGTRADPFQDHITVDGKPLPRPRPRYILMYKPPQVLSSLADPRGRPLVTDLLKGVPERVYPVGRLDFMSEGLLLLTNDGEFANAVAHPSHGVPRTYRVKVKGTPDPASLERIRQGKIHLDGRPVRPTSLAPDGGRKNPWFRIVLKEGRNREVRRLFEAIGHSVVRLKRIGLGPLRLDRLKPGEWRELTAEEIRRLSEYARS